MGAVLFGDGVVEYREDCAAGFASNREIGLQVSLQAIDCDKLYEQEETKKGFIMGYGKTTVDYLGTRMVMKADYKVSQAVL